MSTPTDVKLGVNPSLATKKIESAVNDPNVGENSVAVPETEKVQENIDSEPKDGKVSPDELSQEVAKLKNKDKPDENILNKEQAQIANSVWRESAGAMNEVLPDEETIKVGDQEVKLGSSELVNVKTEEGETGTKVTIDGLTADDEGGNLVKGIKEEVETLAKVGTEETETKIKDMRSDLRDRLEEEAKNPDNEDKQVSNKEIEVDTGEDKNSSVDLNNTRARLTARREALQKSLDAKANDGGKDYEIFSEEQKERIQKEIDLLGSTIADIDAETKVVQTGDQGAMIRYKGSGFTIIGSGDTEQEEELWDEELSGTYSNSIDELDDQGQFTGKKEETATRKDAYEEFKARYKAQHGEDFILEENERLAMYKVFDEEKKEDVIKYIKIASELNKSNGLRDTVISDEITKGTATKEQLNGSEASGNALVGIDEDGKYEAKKYQIQEFGENSGTEDNLTNGQEFTVDGTSDTSLLDQAPETTPSEENTPSEEVAPSEENSETKEGEETVIPLDNADKYQLFLYSSLGEDYLDKLLATDLSKKDERQKVEEGDDAKIKEIQYKSDGSVEIYLADGVKAADLAKQQGEDYVQNLAKLDKEGRFGSTDNDLSEVEFDEEDKEKLESVAAFEAGDTNIRQRAALALLNNSVDKEEDPENPKTESIIGDDNKLADDDKLLLNKLLGGKSIDEGELNRIRGLMGLNPLTPKAPPPRNPEKPEETAELQPPEDGDRPEGIDFALRGVDISKETTKNNRGQESTSYDMTLSKDELYILGGSNYLEGIWRTHSKDLAQARKLKPGQNLKNTTSLGRISRDADGNFKLEGINKDDITRLNERLTKKSEIRSLIGLYNDGVPVEEVMLDEPITLEDLNSDENREYVEGDKDNLRYRALITFLVNNPHPGSSRDVLIKDLKSDNVISNVQTPKFINESIPN